MPTLQQNGTSADVATNGDTHAAPITTLATTAHTADSWIVHKFGGTSVATSECYRNAGEIVLRQNDPTICLPGQRICVVVSAMGEVKAGGLVAKLIAEQRQRRGVQPEPAGSKVKNDKVTNLLIRCTELAAAQNNTYQSVVEELRERHQRVAAELLTADAADSHNAEITAAAQQAQQELKQALDRDFADFNYILRGVWLSRGYDVERAWWFGYGELWSARLFATYLNFVEFVRVTKQQQQHAQSNGVTTSSSSSYPAAFLDARDVLMLAANKDTVPDYPSSTSKLQSWLQSSIQRSTAKIIVVTGYIATGARGHPTTLGRDGSDYSASIFTALLSATSCTIWTDVDGVYSANPTQVSDAVIVDELSYDEASELAYFGAKVIHPKTMTPVVRTEIPIWIRNTFNARHPGSCITSARKIHNLTLHAPQSKPHAHRASDADTLTMSYGVKGVSEIRNLSLIKVEGTGLIGVPGIAHRLFGALRQGNCNVVLITQGGSEHSICFAVPFAQADTAVEVVKREFRDELDVGDINNIDSHGPVACLAIVGDGMSGTRGVAGRFFASLADASVNIVAIAQGSSERNISAIVAQKDVEKALMHAHNAFLRPKALSQPGSSDDAYSPLLKPIRPLSRDGHSKQPIDAESPLSLQPIPPSQSSLSSAFSDAVKLDQQRQKALWCANITLYVAVVIGAWETTLINQLVQRLQAHQWGERKHVHVEIVGLVNAKTRTMLLTDATDSHHHKEHQQQHDDSLTSVQQQYVDGQLADKQGVQPLDIKAVGQHMKTVGSTLHHEDHYSIIIDCSDSEAIYRAYPQWTSAGLRVITQQRSGCLITDMDVVPLLQTLNTLVASGDRVTRIEAVLPSPLAFLFLQPTSKLTESLDFSRCEAVRSLTGIAWQLGYDVQPSDVKLEVDSLRSITHPTDVQAEVNRLVSKAARDNRVPRYVASITLPDADSNDSNSKGTNPKPSLTVGIQEVSQSHPFYWLRGRNTMVIINTHNLSPNPIILQAPVPPQSSAGGRGNAAQAVKEEIGTPCNRASMQLVIGQFSALVSNLSS